jgi:hypothetical protein
MRSLDRTARLIGFEWQPSLPMARSAPVGALERVGAHFANPTLYELADLIPEPGRTVGGRPRLYPALMALAVDALVSV